MEVFFAYIARMKAAAYHAHEGLENSLGNIFRPLKIVFSGTQNFARTRGKIVELVTIV